MILNFCKYCLTLDRVLHVCGDDPKWFASSPLHVKCSPRMWRWSWFEKKWCWCRKVFSTYVEMILSDLGSDHCGQLCSPRMWRWSSSDLPLSVDDFGVLHVCGDDPALMIWRKKRLKCSPRMWRWSPLNRHFFTIITVFSTYVEMILLPPIVSSYWGGVLHVCGDDPKLIGISNLEPMCSPRMWRWSFCKTNQKLETQVFSTYVEMIPANTI